MSTDTNPLQRESGRLYTEYLSFKLRNSTASRIEAQCTFLLEKNNPYFVQAAEGAIADCGLLCVDTPPQHKDGSYRLFNTIAKYRDQKVLLALDVKSIITKFSRPQRGGFVYHHIISTPPQILNVQAYIVFSTSTPNLVAVIPSSYLRKKKKVVNRWYGREMPLNCQDVPSFPLELMPFVMPVEFLCSAMDVMRNFLFDRTSHWYNPYNNILFKKCPKPVLRSAKLLLPSEDNSLTQEFFRLERLWNALRQHSAKYRFEKLVLQPSVGDFQIVHLESGTPSIFEMKTGLSWITEGVNLRHQCFKIHHGRKIYQFRPESMWDFLFTVTISNEVVIAFRDDLPMAWFRPLLVDSEEYLVNWTPTRHHIRDITIDWKHVSDVVFVQRLERVLDMYYTGGCWSAKRDIPIVAESVTPNYDENSQHSEEEEEEQDIVKQTAALQRGSGRNWSPTLWEAEMEEWLMRSCGRSGRGHFFRVGHNPSGRFVFVPGRRDIKEDLRYEELPVGLPMVYVNFARIDLLDKRMPTDARHPVLFNRATHGPTPSIFILVPGPVEDVWKPIDRFVVPSTALNTAERRAFQDKGIKTGEYSNNPTTIRLVHNEMIDAYTCANDKVVAELCRIFEQPPSVDTLLMGNLEMGIGTEIKLDDFIVNKQKVLCETMAVWDNNCWLSNAKFGADIEDANMEV